MMLSRMHILFQSAFLASVKLLGTSQSGSCNRKLIGARPFAASAITRGMFNATQDYVPPFYDDGLATKIDIWCIHI